jgi:hypothetical protein
MAETPDQIKQHIEERRGRITEDINELEYRVKRTVDWRTQFSRHTPAIMGAAFGAGVLLAFLTANRRRDHEEEDED